MSGDKKNKIDWLIKILNDAKARGIDTFSFNDGFLSPDIEEIGVSNLTGVTIYLTGSKWDAMQKKRRMKEDKQELDMKKHSRMIDIWNDSPKKVQEKFLKTLLKHFASKHFLSKKESKELSKILE